MAITEIKRVRNDSDVYIAVKNMENSSTNNNPNVQPRQTKICAIWVPWCWEPAQWKGHHIKVGDYSLPDGRDARPLVIFHLAAWGVHPLLQGRLLALPFGVGARRGRGEWEANLGHNRGPIDQVRDPLVKPLADALPFARATEGHTVLRSSTCSFREASLRAKALGRRF